MITAVFTQLPTPAKSVGFGVNPGGNNDRRSLCRGGGVSAVLGSVLVLGTSRERQTTPIKYSRD